MKPTKTTIKDSNCYYMRQLPFDAKTLRGGHVSVNGVLRYGIIHYSTVIAVWAPGTGWVVTKEKYSVTTSKIVNMLMRDFHDMGRRVALATESQLEDILYRGDTLTNPEYAG